LENCGLLFVPLSTSSCEWRIPNKNKKRI
jgi:hypothetical protein